MLVSTVALAALIGVAAPLLWATPWILVPAVALLRASRSRSLDGVAAEPPANPPLVSVIVPARNERRNIERCVRSLLGTRYSACEIIVVDDHSDDGTATIARAAAGNDSRLRVVPAPALPAGWLGKQWACATGAAEARGEFLLFTDADTWHAPDLLSRAMRAALHDSAELFSLAGEQEMRTFWERLIQPQVFAILTARYGGTEHVSRARRPADAIANGQFMLFPRASYQALGTHAAVRDVAAEDLALAQRCVRERRRLLLMMAGDRLRTRMYASLGELIRGWGKNVYAGGRHAVLGGRVGRALFPLLLLIPPSFQLAPVVAVALSVAGIVSTSYALWGAVCVTASVAYFALLYGFMRAPRGYALLFPLGAVAVLYICVGALARGSRIQWKGRHYVTR